MNIDGKMIAVLGLLGWIATASEWSLGGTDARFNTGLMLWYFS